MKVLEQQLQRSCARAAAHQMQAQLGQVRQEAAGVTPGILVALVRTESKKKAMATMQVREEEEVAEEDEEDEEEEDEDPDGDEEVGAEPPKKKSRKCLARVCRPCF